MSQHKLNNVVLDVFGAKRIEGRIGVQGEFVMPSRIDVIRKYLDDHPKKYFSAKQLRILTGTSLSNLNYTLRENAEKGKIEIKDGLVPVYKSKVKK